MHLNIELTKKKVVFGFIFFGVFLIGFLAAFFGLKLSKMFVKDSPKANVQVAQSSETANDGVSFGIPTESVKEKGVYDTVLLGYGGAGHSGGTLTDSIIVVHVNTNKKTAALISIPRDLYVNGDHKINAEASINGFANEGGVIKNVTGLNIDYFAAIDFASFQKLIDNLGGISVDVPKTFDDAFYPVKGLENETCGKTLDEINALKAKYSDAQLEMQFTCRYEHLHFDKGPAKLDGATALKFVRSRHGDSDFGRSERQFAVLKGILARLLSLHALDKTNSTIDTLTQMVKTNLSVNTLKDLIQIMGDTGQYKITEIHLTTDNLLNEGKSAQGAYILYPKAGMFNFSEIKNYISSSI